MQEEIKEEPADRHQCDWCVKNFKDKALLMRHVRTVHPDQREQEKAVQKAQSLEKQKASHRQWNQDNQGKA